MTPRKVFFWSHLVVGLLFGLLILSMCITGTLLAFEPQLIQRAEHALQNVVPPAEGSQPLRIDALLLHAKAAHPKGSPSTITFKSSANASVTVWFGKEKLFYLNPYNGQILGESSKTRVFFKKVLDWHKYLSFKGGDTVTGTTAGGYFLLSLSGIYLWWPRRVFTLQGTGRGRDWNWHNTIGLVSVPFVLAITATGFIMAFGLLPRRPPTAPKTGPDAMNIQNVFQEAQAMSPHWKSITLRIPGKPGETPTAFVQPPPGGRVPREWMKPIHTGQVLGIPGQFSNFLIAIAGILQIWTGVALAWRRFRKEPS